MLDRFFQFGFMLAVVFFTYSAGVMVNLFDVWPNGLYVKILDSVDDGKKRKRSRRKH